MKEIPMEVTTETIRDFGIDIKDVVWRKIGSRKVKVVLIPVTPELYSEYMRPLWREDKRLQRHGYDLPLEDFQEDSRIEDIVDLIALKEALRDLEELDRTIVEMFSENQSEISIGKAVGMSQKGVNKRKHKIFKKLFLKMST